jgi:hypothetical protein
VKNLVFALLAAVFSTLSFADAMDKDAHVTFSNRKPGSANREEIRMPPHARLAVRSPAAAHARARGSVANSFSPAARTATGVFVPEGDSFLPARRELYLYITPAAQRYASIIRQAAAQWSSACGVQFDYVNEQAPATAPPGHTVVVVDYGPGALEGTSATTFRKASPDGQALSYAKVVITNTRGDADLYFVALHELGHGLGLPHASDRAAVMHWTGERGYYISTGTRASLTSTDITGCRQMMASSS